jgi:hypothetical protein
MWESSELEVLRAIRGPLYARRRDRALSAGVSFTEVRAQASAQPDRRLEITAAFLAGWQEDRDRYEAFDRALDGIDLAAEGRKITGIKPAVRAVVEEAREEHGEKLLPYCWERVVKLAEQAPPWRWGACFDYVAALPHEASIEPMLWCVDEAPDPYVRDGAHQTLVALISLVAKDRLQEGKRPHASRAFVYDDLLMRLKLAGKKKG